jgi:transaldolase
MPVNPLQELRVLGQSVWLDFIDRDLLTSGGLDRLIEEDGVAGLTSNPTILERAIGGSGAYDDAIRAEASASAGTQSLYEAMALQDVRSAADRLAPLYRASGARDGYVSLEVSPHLAQDTNATIQEARRLWTAFDRPNAMIKVPATAAGLPAIQRLLADGININVTLLFGLDRYRGVVEAFLAGLESRTASGKPIDRVASVASFFVSRIDTLVDHLLDASAGETARVIRGQAAIASARLAYQHYKQWTATPRWRPLQERGARPQRLLWASTSTKDPTYSDIKYIEALIGPDTVVTIPPDALTAYREQGRPARRLESDLLEAVALPDALGRCNIRLDAIAAQLEREGVQKFVEPFDALLASLERRRRELRS